MCEYVLSTTVFTIIRQYRQQRYTPCERELGMAWGQFQICFPGNLCWVIRDKYLTLKVSDNTFGKLSTPNAFTFMAGHCCLQKGWTNAPQTLTVERWITIVIIFFFIFAFLTASVASLFDWLPKLQRLWSQLAVSWMAFRPNQGGTYWKKRYGTTADEVSM